MTLGKLIAGCGFACVALAGAADALAQASSYRTLRMDAIGCRERQDFLAAMRLDPDRKRRWLTC